MSAIVQVPMQTAELLARLERHYIKPGAPLPGGVFIPECGWNPAGLSGGCDAIFVGFTSTSGRILVGHELKISRADWLNELNKPGKADAWADQCHQWYLVVSDRQIVHDGELPAGWGLMTPGKSKTRMNIDVKAETKRDHQPSWRAVRSIMARLDTLRAASIAASAQRQREQMHAESREYIAAEVERRMRAVPEADKLAKQLEAVETALGARIDWSERSYTSRGFVSLKDLTVIAAAAREHGNLGNAIDALAGGYQLPQLRRSLEQAEEALANLRAVPGAQLERA